MGITKKQNILDNVKGKKGNGNRKNVSSTFKGTSPLLKVLSKRLDFLSQ